MSSIDKDNQKTKTKKAPEKGARSDKSVSDQVQDVLANKKEKPLRDLNTHEKNLADQIKNFPNGNEVISLRQKGKISGPVFEEFSDILKNPKTAQTDGPYQNLIKAVLKGKIPDKNFIVKGKSRSFILILIDQLRIGHQSAVDLVGEYSKSTAGEITGLSMKEYLVENPAPELIPLETLVGEGIDTSQKVKEFLKEAGMIEEIEQTNKLKFRNWTPESLPQADILETKKLQQEIMPLAKVFHAEHYSKIRTPELQREFERKNVHNLRQEIELSAANIEQLKRDGHALDSPEIREHKDRIKDLEILIDVKIEEQKILDAMDKYDNILIPYLQTMKERNEQLKMLKYKLGFDLRTIDKLKTPDGEIKIEKIEFENISDQLNIHAGELTITFIDEKGNLVTKGIIEFQKEILEGQGAYPVVASLEQIQKIANYQTRNKVLEVDDVFRQLGYPSSLENSPTNQENLPQFRITNIDAQKKGGEITLDKKITYSKNLKSNKLSFGEFVSFISRNGYFLDISDNDPKKESQKLQNALDGLAKQNEEELKIYTQDGEEKFVQYHPTTLNAPEYPGHEVPILYKGHPAFLKKKDDGSYDVLVSDLDMKPEKDQNGNIILTPDPSGVPESRITPQPRPKHRRIETLSAPQLMELQNKNAIQDSPASTTDPEPTEEEVEAVQGKNRKFFEEALPYNEVVKIGQVSTDDAGFLRKLYRDTYLLSPSDIWELGKTMYEYYKRQFERNQKNRYSNVAKNVPFFSPEMKRIKTSAEQEQVNQFKESLNDEDIWVVQDTLRNSNNVDEVKAAFIVLAGKGQIRWDDIEMWRNLNKFVDPSYYIPIPTNGDPNTKISEKDQRTGFDFLPDAINSIWGNGQYNEWISQNKGNYDSSVKKFYEKGRELETSQGGHGEYLSNLLAKHKNGEYVDPHEYEGLIMQAIDDGKYSMDGKVYFMVEGVAALSPDGRTIMSFERMAHINAQLLGKFPLLDYMVTRAPRPPDGKPHRFTIHDYRKWIKIFDQDDPMNTTTNKHVDKFLWENILTSNPTHKRINKVLRNGENIDHDDIYAYLPPASETVIEGSCKSTVGSKKFLTIEGYANVFPGFSQYMRTLADIGDGGKLMEAIKSFVRFESVMSNRWKKGNDGYQRFDNKTWRSGTVVTPDTPPQYYREELKEVIQKVATAYGELNPKLYELSQLIYHETAGDSVNDQNKAEQDKVQTALETFGKEFEKAVKKDKGRRMLSIVQSSNLLGMPYSAAEEREKRKGLTEDELDF